MRDLIIGIVGGDEKKFTPKQKVQMSRVIDYLFDPTNICKVFDCHNNGGCLFPFYGKTCVDLGNARIFLSSGRCPAGGVDIIAENKAQERGYYDPALIFKPKHLDWNDGYACKNCNASFSKLHSFYRHVDETGHDAYYLVWIGYKSRNIMIAKASKVIYDIEPVCGRCNGTGQEPFLTKAEALNASLRDLRCQACEGRGTKWSGGTWTANYAIKNLRDRSAFSVPLWDDKYEIRRMVL